MQFSGRYFKEILVKPKREDKEVVPIEASKVTVNPVTYEKQKVLTNKQRRKLRQRKVIELIQDTPAGQYLTATAFAEATGIDYFSVNKFINRMLRDGLIAREGHPKAYTYFIPVKGKKISKPIVDKASEVAQELVVPTTEVPHYERHLSPVMTELTEQDIKAKIVADMAKAYYWETTDNSLRGFVKWAEKGGHMATDE